VTERSLELDHMEFRGKGDSNTEYLGVGTVRVDSAGVMFALMKSDEREQSGSLNRFLLRRSGFIFSVSRRSNYGGGLELSIRHLKSLDIIYEMLLFFIFERGKINREGVRPESFE